MNQATETPGLSSKKGKPHMSLFGKQSATNDEARSSSEDLGDEYYVYPVEQHPIHTPDTPFCDDMSCPCHGDNDALNTLTSYYQDGLVSSEDADRIYQGKTF